VREREREGACVRVLIKEATRRVNMASTS